MKKIRNTLLFVLSLVAMSTAQNTSQCVMTCPADIVQDNDPGQCSANVTVPAPTLSADCLSTMENELFSEDFNACALPGGWAVIWEDDPTGDMGGNTGIGPCISGAFFNFDCTTSASYSLNGDNPNFDGCIASLADDDAGSMADGTGTLESPVVPLTPGGNYNLSFDYSFDALSSEFRTEVWDGAAWVAILTETTDLNESPTLDVSAFANADFQVRFVHDDLANSWAWGLGLDNIVIAEVVAIPPVVTNDFNGTDDASGVYPVGTTTVTFTIEGTAISCSMDVTVEDNEFPVIDCPDNIFINLSPGECAATVSYNVDASDNCPVFSDPLTASPIGIGAGGGSTFDMIYFDILNTGTEDILITSLDQAVFDNGNYTWELYTATTSTGNETNPGAWTQIGTATGAAGGGTINIPLTDPLEVSAGGSVGIAVGVSFPAGFPLLYAFPPVPAPDVDANGITIDATNGGATTNVFAGTLLVPRGWIGNINYLIGGPAEAVQIDNSGLTSGDEFPIGITTQIWSVTDGEGNVSTCSFDIEVVEYTGAITALACNDHVNISLDETCQVTVGADMILEGGPYGCYDNYIVDLDIGGNVITAPGEYTVTVTDPATGNSCWGTITAEDKLAPEIECIDFEVTCIEEIVAAPLPPFNGTISGGAGIVIDPVATGTYTIEFDVVGDCEVTDLNVAIDISHTWIGDLQISLESPSGTTAVLYPGVCGATDDLNKIWDDEGPIIVFCNELQDGEPFDHVGSIGGPTVALSTFDGESALGVWTMTIDDTVGADGGVVNNVSLIFDNCTVPGRFPEDACGLTVFDYSDEVTFGDCASGVERVIERTWVATDGSGNSSSCVQTITVNNISIEDLLLPPSLVELTCGAGTSPEDIVAFFDNPLTRDNVNTPDVIEFNEGFPFAYPHYFIGIHPQKVDNNVCDLYATYTDQSIPACGPGCDGNEKVIRTWTILDWCTQETATYVQVIKAVDNEPPTFIATDMEVSTDPWGCAADIVMDPPWELHDNCTDNVTYAISGPAGVVLLPPNTPQNPGEYWIALGAPRGVHTFTYWAEDCCGNVSSQDITVTVADNTPPVAVAKQNIVISLTTDVLGGGAAKLYAESVDNGSYDGCSDVHLEVRRPESPSDCGNIGLMGYNNNLSYNNDFHPNDAQRDTDGGAFVKFCCADLTEVDANGVAYGIVQVEMRVWDDADENGIFGTAGDNYNTTWADVRVEDKLPPILVCPPDVTITCEDDYTNTDITGEANAYATCDGVNVDYQDIVVNINTCQEGFVIRRWSVEGTSIQCDQRIDIIRVGDPFTENNINWARDDEATCDEVDEGETTWVSGPCDVIAASIIERDTFLFEDGACLKIVNLWRVIDWCAYDQSGGTAGYWDNIQILKILDDEAPLLECEDEMFAIDDNADEDEDGNVCETIDLTLTNVASDEGECASDWLKWRVDVDLWADGTVDYEFSSYLPPFNPFYVAPTASGEEVSVTIPEDIVGSMSNHKVFWNVADGCGNVTSCDNGFMVVDKKAPTPYCVSLSTAVMENGEVELWAIDFNVGSFDNCTPEDHLRYTFSDVAPEDDPNYIEDYRSSYRVFTTADVPQVEVNMYVWDEKGNKDFCVVFLTLVDNGGNGTPRMIAGNIATEADEPVSEAKVVLTSVIPEHSGEQMTDDAGHYAFEDNQDQISYTIAPERTGDWKNGVSTLDIVLIQRHILGLQLLDSPYKMIAADVTADGYVKGSDIVELRKLVLNVIPEFSNNESWRFVDAASTVSTSPISYISTIDIAQLNADMMHEEFVGVKIGDIDGNAKANLNAVDTDVRSGKTLTLEVEEMAVTEGELVEIPVTSSNYNDVYGYQFTMELNGLNYEGVKAGALTMDENNIGVISENIITVSYGEVNGVTSSDVLFTLVMRAERSGNISEMMAISSRLTQAEAYVTETLDITNVELGVRNSTSELAYELYQNEPNPFKTSTIIGFNMAERGQATITVYDISGKVVTVVEGEYEAGYNQEELDRSDLNVSSGVLYYQFETGDFTATKKMIIIE